MKAVLLLAGPSLIGLGGKLPQANVSIGAKRAALYCRCDWCVILDSPAMAAFGDTAPGLLLTKRRIRKRYCPDRPGLNLDDIPCSLLTDNCYTSVAALALAWHLGAKQIEVFGADFGAGESSSEFDGYVAADANHTKERWERERAAWNEMIIWLGVRRVEVMRK